MKRACDVDVAGSSKRKKATVKTRRACDVAGSKKVQTLLFFIGQRPFKAVVFLPRLTDHSTETIEQALAQQHPDKDFPPLPPGKFENVRNSKESQVMFFRYDTTVGCRSTCSTQHSNITPPLKRHKNKHTLTREPKIRVGFDYIFGCPHSYDITEEGQNYPEVRLTTQSII